MIKLSDYRGWMNRRSGVCTAVLLIAATACRDSLCGDQIVQDFPSIDGRQHAVVFERDCGATTDLSTQVSVLPRAGTISGGGNVFVADADHGKVANGPAVTVHWIDEKTLEIRYDHRARVFLRDTLHGDTKIRYVPQ